jgi:hypothetical protein
VAKITGNACCNAASCGIISALIQGVSKPVSSPEKTGKYSKNNTQLSGAGDSASVSGIALAW